MVTGLLSPLSFQPLFSSHWSLYQFSSMYFPSGVMTPFLPLVFPYGKTRGGSTGGRLLHGHWATKGLSNPVTMACGAEVGQSCLQVDFDPISSSTIYSFQSFQIYHIYYHSHMEVKLAVIIQFRTMTFPGSSLLQFLVITLVATSNGFMLQIQNL